MVREIERAGIPIVHVCNLADIAKGIGSNRIVLGKSVLYPMGDPKLPYDAELKYRKQLAGQALSMLDNN